MATKKAAAATAKVAATVSPDPDDTQSAGGAGDSDPVIDTPIETVDAFVAEVQDAPGGTGGGGGGGGAAVSPRASSIPIAVGSAGFYTGARPAETLAQYKTRLGTTYGTFGDLGTMLGTAPKA
jgi:hypothetical protein